MLRVPACKTKYEFIPEDEKGIAKIKGFLTIMFYASAHNFNVSDLWSGKFMVGQFNLSQIMTRDTFWSIWRHFRVVSPIGLAASGQEFWHPWQNIESSLEILRQNSRDLWTLGSCLCLDESRVIMTSRRMAMRSFIPNKPNKLGLNIYTLSDHGKYNKNADQMPLLDNH